MKLLAIFLVLSCGSNVVSPAERDAAITENELVRRTQELYDAVVPGNQVPRLHWCLRASSRSNAEDYRRRRQLVRRTKWKQRPIISGSIRAFFPQRCRGANPVSLR